MKVTYQLQLTDWQAADRFFAMRRVQPPRSGAAPRWFFRLCLLVFVVLPLVFIPLHYLQTPTFHAAWATQGISALGPVAFFLLPFLFFVCLWLAAPLLRGRWFKQSPYYQREMTLSIESGGLRGKNLIHWRQVSAVEETPEHIIFILTNDSYLLVPRRAFDSDFGATQFAVKARDTWKNALS